MKNFILAFFLFANTFAFAQEKIEVQQKEWAIGDAMQPAFVVEIPQTNSKKAINLWEETLVPKNIFDTFKKLPKMEKEDKNQWVIHKVVVEEISPDSLDVYTRISEKKDRITFAALFDNYGNFIGTDPANAENASEYVRKYAVELYRQGVEDELDDLKKDLKRMESDYSSYEKDNRKLDKKSAASLSELNAQSDSKKSGSTSELSEERLKELKKTENSIKKLSNKIEKNEDRQKKLSKEIDKTKDEIKAVQKKLKNIK